MDYEKLFLKHGHSYGYSGYLTQEHQNYVYEEVCRILKVDKWPAAYSILEAGSGAGLFYQFLMKLSSMQNVPLRFFQFQYYGIDSCRKVCEATTLKHGEFFQNIDVLNYNKNCDYVVCLSMLGTDQDEKLISKIVSLSKVGVVLEFFIGHPYLKPYKLDEMFEMLSPYKVMGFRSVVNSYLFYLNTKHEAEEDKRKFKQY